MAHPISLEKFREFAREFNVIPVAKKIAANNESPLTIYLKLAQNKVDTFLLESAESNGVWSRYSFIGVNSEATLTEKSGSVFWRGVMPAGAPTGVDPLEALRISAAHLR